MLISRYIGQIWMVVINRNIYALEKDLTKWRFIQAIQFFHLRNSVMDNNLNNRKQSFYLVLFYNICYNTFYCIVYGKIIDFNNI